MVDVLAIVIIVAFFAFSALVVRWLGRVVEDAAADSEVTDTAAAGPDGELVPAGGGDDTGWRM
jgi:hypothetical protein